MSIKSKLVSGTLISSTSTALVALIQLLIIPMLIHGLGAYEFGLIGIVNILSINGYLSLFDIGLTSSVQRFVSKHYSLNQINSVKRLIESTFTILLLIGLILFLSVYFFLDNTLLSIFNIDADYENIFLGVIKIFSLSYLFQFPTLVLQSSLLGLLNFLHAKAIVIFIEISKLIGIYVVFLNGGDILDIIKLYVSLHALNFFLSIVVVYFHLGFFNIIGISIDSIREIRSFATIQTGSKMTSIIFNQSDRLFIGVYLGPLAMSAFDVMMKIPALINKFLGLSMSAIVPVVGGMDFKRDKKLILSIYDRGIKAYTFFIIPTMVLMYFIIPEFLFIWVGDDYVYLAYHVRLLLVWSLLSVFTFGSNLLTGLNRGMSELLSYRIIQMLIKLLTLFFLIGNYGLLAIPLSFILSMLSVFYLVVIYKKYLDIKILPAFLNVIKYLSFSALTIYSIESLHILSIGSSIITFMSYAGMCLLIVWSVGWVLFFSRGERQSLIKRIRHEGKF